MPNKLNELTQRMTQSQSLPREWVLWFQELVTLIGNKLDTVLSAEGKLPVMNAVGELEASSLDADAVVTGSGTSEVGHLAVFADTTATLIKDGGDPFSLEAADTVVSETSYSQAAIVGADDGTYARGGHSHGTPALPALDDLSDVALTAVERGDVLYRGAAGWNNLSHGTDGQVLTTKGHGANPEWEAVTVPEAADTVVEETTYGQASTAGTEDTYSRSDHTHGTPDAVVVPEASDTVESETSFGVSANAGAADTFSRGDHTHGTPAAPSIPEASDTVEAQTTFGASSSAGTSDDYSRADHKHGTPAEPHTDGWIADADTWVYVSATSFKIEGKDVTSRFPVGCKLKLTQTNAKYFYVVSAAFSTDTTVTVTGGSDYTIANDTITSPCYSYQSCPQGFPQWFNFTETWTGFSSAPSGAQCRFRVEGRQVTYLISRNVPGTSNANTCTVTLPITAVTLTGYAAYNYGLAQDNSTWYDSGYSLVGSGSTVASFRISVNVTTWNTSGNKNWRGQIRYEI